MSIENGTRQAGIFDGLIAMLEETVNGKKFLDSLAFNTQAQLEFMTKNPNINLNQMNQFYAENLHGFTEAIKLLKDSNISK
jgi:hypothetical protein